MVLGTSHVHSHGEDAGHDGDVAIVAASGAEGTPADAAGEAHGHDTTATADGSAEVAQAALAAPANWPRPWNPENPVDLSGVEGVTPEQQLRATALILRTLEELPDFADVDGDRRAGLPLDR